MLFLSSVFVTVTFLIISETYFQISCKFVLLSVFCLLLSYYFHNKSAADFDYDKSKSRIC